MISAGMKAVLEAVRDTMPFATYTDLEPKVDMCERILTSHLKRLTVKGYLVYDKGTYVITPEGEDLLNGS